MSAGSTRIGLISALIVIALIVTVVFLSLGFFNPAAEKVLPGVRVMGIDLGGLNLPKGLAQLEELEKKLRAEEVTLSYHEQSWPLLLSETGLDLDEEEIMEEALRSGREGNAIQRLKDRKQLRQSGVAIDPAINFDQDRLKQRTDEFTKGIVVEPLDASFVIEGNDAVSIRPGKDGTAVDMEKLVGDLTEVIVESKNPQVELAMINVAPARSAEMLQSTGINGLLAGYYTRFDSSKTSRTYNVNVAAGAFDELLVLPGHNVSFNEVVGPRSSEAGYKNAPVIVDNEFVDGLGGGVCQVSTTLYNCVLLAGLEVVERTCHSLPVSYVPIGRDATVVYGAIDFSFCNNTDDYIYVKSFVSGGQLGIKIYGNTAHKKDVQVNTWVTQEIEPRVIYEDDPNLPKGEEVVKQEGSKGFRVSGERLFLVKGAVETRESLYSSEYSSINKIVAVGTLEQVLPQIAPSVLQSDAGRTNSNATVPQSPEKTNQPADGVDSNGAAVEPANGGNNGKPAVNQALPGAKQPAGEKQQSANQKEASKKESTETD